MVEKVIFILCIYLKSDGPGGQWSSLLWSLVKPFRVWDTMYSLICPCFVLMFGFMSHQINSMPYLCLCVSGMMEKRVWSSIPILRISLICGRKKCCRTPRTKGKKRGSRRYICWLYMALCFFLEKGKVADIACRYATLIAIQTWQSHLYSTKATCINSVLSTLIIK